VSDVNLNEEELIVLRDVLESYLSDLRMEIADTDSFDFRKELKQKEERLKGILDKIA